MANKALATRQKMRLKVAVKIEPSLQLGKPRNPVAVAAKLRAAGPHKKGATATRQAEKRALAKAKLVAEE
jgi:hypothetical protein